MAATLKIITSKVGDGGQKTGAEVRRILQLLRRAGHLPANASLTNWSKAAGTATAAFHDSIGAESTEVFDPGVPGDALLELAKQAAVVLPLAPGTNGATAFLAFWTTAVERAVPYCWSGGAGYGQDKVAYGLHGYDQYLIFAGVGAAAPFNPDPAQNGLGMNCISFTNLALSIWRTGCAHAAPYDCSQAAGGFKPVSDRYGMSCRPNPRCEAEQAVAGAAMDLLKNPFPLWSGPPVPFSPTLSPMRPRAAVSAPKGSKAAEVKDMFFYDHRDVLDVVQDGKLYYVQWCYVKDKVTPTTTLPAGFGHHDTVLYNGDIYEINVTTPALQCTPLAARMAKASKDAVRLYGPA